MEPSAEANDYWFWPWLDNAEPDLVVQLGTTLVVIEAKYLWRAIGPTPMQRGTFLVTRLVAFSRRSRHASGPDLPRAPQPLHA
jgi:hypothetical protein